MRYGFIIDNRKCIGCHACTTACKSEHQVAVGVNRTWVKQVEKGTFPNTRRLFSVMRCNHCTDAPCVDICPVQALYTREDGIIDVSEKNDILYIFTNTTRLALEIARGIRYEFGGSIQYEWFERNQYIRAKWFSEIQNREYFKSRIRAAKENRIGMFSFEDR